MKRKTIAIGPSTINNGRIYFETTDILFFPADALCDRKKNGIKGKPVKFVAGSLVRETDVTIKSGKKLTPHMVFSPFLREVGAVEDGQLLVTRTADREYLVEYIAPSAA